MVRQGFVRSFWRPPPLSPVYAEAVEFLSHRPLFVSVSPFVFGFSQEPLLVLGKGFVGASLLLPQQDRTNVHVNNMYEILPVANIQSELHSSDGMTFSIEQKSTK